MRAGFMVMLKVLLVLWHIEVRMDGNSFALGCHLVNFQFALALAFLGNCWCFTSGLGIRYGHVLDQAPTSKRVMKQV